MKKIFMLAAAAATLFAVSCNRAQGPEALVEEEDNSPVAVRFGSNLAVVGGVTKAAVDEFTGAEDLYIYALTTDKADTLIKNVSASSPVLAATPIVYDDPETEVVESTNWLKGEISVWDPAYQGQEVPFFYGNSGQVYDFFAYYVGDALDAPEPNEEGLTLDVPFDGTQDIMLATTDKNYDYENRRVDPTTQQKVQLAFNSVYSAKAARKDVHPTLLFKHQLSRFVFELQFRPVDRVDEAQLIKIEEITLTSPSNLVTLDIDDQTAEFDLEQPAIFTLMDENGEPYANGAINTTDWTQAGESIMVAPGASVYHMTMQYSYEYNGTPLQNLPTFEWDINLPGLLEQEGYVALPGKKYIVKLVVYGPEEVKVSVALAEWEDVELPEIDPDAE